MAMSSGVLASQLLGLVPAATEAEAVVTLASAYAVFAADAVAGAVPITAAGVLLGRTAMQAALFGMSAPGAGAAVIAAAIQAFWGAVALGLAASFSGAAAITPPPHAGLQPLLETAFAVNTATSADLVTAAQSVATVIHNQAIIGGTATFPGPVVSPIT